MLNMLNFYHKNHLARYIETGSFDHYARLNDCLNLGEALKLITW